MTDRKQAALHAEMGLMYLYLAVRSRSIGLSRVRPEHLTREHAAIWSQAVSRHPMPTLEELGCMSQLSKWAEHEQPLMAVGAGMDRHIEAAEQLVIDAWRERTLAHSLREAIELAESGDVDDAIRGASEAVNTAMAGCTTSSETHQRAAGRLMAEWAESMRTGMRPTLPMPIEAIQNSTGGWVLGKLYEVVAITSAHKTTFCRQAAWHVAKAIPNGHVLYWTMEDDNTAIAGRTLAQEVRDIDTRMLQVGERPKGSDFDLEDMTTAAIKHIDSEPSKRLRYIERREPTIGEVLGVISSECARGCRLVVLDFLQLIQPNSSKTRDENQHWFAVSNVLASFAKLLHVPIIVSCQTTAEAQRKCLNDRTDVNMADIRGGASITQAAHGVFVLNPVWVRDTDGKPTRDRSRLKISMEKNKSGPTPEGVFGVIAKKDTIA